MVFEREIVVFFCEFFDFFGLSFYFSYIEDTCNGIENGLSGFCCCCLGFVNVDIGFHAFEFFSGGIEFFLYLVNLSGSCGVFPVELLDVFLKLLGFLRFHLVFVLDG